MDRNRLEDALIAAGKRLDARRLVSARDGNLSARLAPDRFLVTATGVRKGELRNRDLVEVDEQGKPVGSGHPTTEIGLHLTVYRQRPDVRAVVHAHPPVAVGFATAGLDLTELLLPEVAVDLGPVPLVAYATPGTPDLERAVGDIPKGHNGFLLANHGAVTVGETVDQALDRMETLEHLAWITLSAKLLGGAVPLTPEQLARLRRPEEPAS